MVQLRNPNGRAGDGTRIDRDQAITRLDSRLLSWTAGFNFSSYNVSATLDPPDAIVRSNELALFAEVDPRKCACGYRKQNQKAGYESYLKIPVHRKIDLLSGYNLAVISMHFGCQPRCLLRRGKSLFVSALRNYRIIGSSDLCFLEGISDIR